MYPEFKYIIIHHTTKPDGETLDWQGIRKYHMSFRIDYQIVSREDYLLRVKANDGKVFETPWSDVGYHFGVERVSGQYEVIVGRPLTKSGSHCIQLGMNHKAIGICFIGNYDVANPDSEMLTIALKRIILPLCKTFNINWNFVIGHREVNGVQKTCPGRLFDTDAIREAIKHEL